MLHGKNLGNRVWDKVPVNEFYEMMFNFLKEKKQMLILSISEGIKDSGENISLVKLLDPIFSGFLKYLESNGIPVNDKMDFLITSFFFSTVPMVMYIVLEDKFAGFYGFDVQQLEEKFLKVFSRIYIEHGYEASIWDSKQE